MSDNEILVNEIIGDVKEIFIKCKEVKSKKERHDKIQKNLAHFFKSQNFEVYPEHKIQYLKISYRISKKHQSKIILANGYMNIKFNI